MKSLIKTLVCTLALVAMGPADIALAAVDSGRPAPDFTFTDLSGKTQKLSDYRGKVVILEWLDPPFSCGHWTPELVRMAGGNEVIGQAGRPVSYTHLTLPTNREV